MANEQAPAATLANGRSLTPPPDLARFIDAIFDRADLVLVRPTETWAEAGRKQSRVVYKETKHLHAKELAIGPMCWQWLCEVSQREKANFFFGVCPRFGGEGYDLAWQIRTVRVLWCDIDNCTPGEALKRCADAGLPPPSVVVLSGHGVHLYWLLAEPFLIDDVGGPRQVRVGWVEQPDGSNKPRRYVIDEGGQRHFLNRIDPKTGADSRAPDPLFPYGLSDKARHAQDVLGGIAKKVGGDHTHDLARLLRLVGTLNRKDERNGKAPVPCVLVECHPEHRYQFADFERFAAVSPERIRREAVAKVPLPTPRKLSAGRRDRLGELVTECAAAPPGQRSERNWHLVCWAIEKGVSREEVWQHVQGVGKFAEGGQRYFDRTWEKAEGHTREQLWEKARRPRHAGRGGRHHSNGVPAQPETVKAVQGDWGGALPSGDPCTDTQNGIRFVRHFGTDFRHCHPWKKDLVWEGSRWREDGTGQVARWAKLTGRKIYIEAADTEDSKAHEILLAWAKHSDSAKAHAAMMREARSEPTVPVEPADLDADPWLLNCPNGTLDLRTGTLREQKREDYLTRLCPTPYRPDAVCPAWERFLGAVFPDAEDEPDRELITFVQRLLGRCLTGDVSEQVLPIFWGGGANGKSTLVNAFFGAVGHDYAMKANADLLMASRGERHPTELAGLFGMRLVVASETQQGRRLDEALVKDLTGGERIRARRMREDFWEFAPTHKVILLTNHKPGIRGTDDAIWRRLRLVPFTATFWDPADPGKDPLQLPGNRRQDKQLGAKLASEREGILAWLVRGCLDWQRDGLTLPEQVKVATREYRQDEDVVGGWLAERCITGGHDYRCRAADLYADYRAWCERAGEEPAKQKTFGAAMTERGFGRDKSNGVWYLGIALRHE